MELFDKNTCSKKQAQPTEKEFGRADKLYLPTWQHEDA